MTHTSGRTTRIWRDGKLVDWNLATIHVMSHVVHYGSSVFEGIRCYETPEGPAIFRLADHLRRLADSCRIYRIPLRHSADVLARACVDTVRANDLTDCYLRPVVARTGEQMGVLDDEGSVETFIIAWRWGAYLGPEALANGVDVRVASWRRPAPNTHPALAKAGGNYLNAQLALGEARLDGYDEAILLDTAGYVSEGSGENLFLVRDRVLYTPPPSAGILQGITRDTVITIARDLGHEVREELIPREVLYVADEIFLTGTAAEVTPVRSVDRNPVGAGGRPGPITMALQAAYLGVAHGSAPDMYDWLTSVDPD